jgi:hypothetical protein
VKRHGRSAQTLVLRSFEGRPTNGRGTDPHHYPAWWSLALYVTRVVAMLRGAVPGGGCRPRLVGDASQLDDRQDVNFAGASRYAGLIEDYITEH